MPVVLINGAGWGHGVGMAQDGAYWMGRGGASTAAILAQFYPQTRLARGSGAVRVVVADSPSGEVGLAFPAGGELRDDLAGPQSQGFPIGVAPGGQVLVRFDGTRYSVQPGATDAGTASLPATPVVNRSGGAGLPLVPPAGGVAPVTKTTTPPVPLPTPGQPSPPSSATTTTTTAPSPATTAPPPQTTTTTTGPPPRTARSEATTTTLPLPPPPPPPPAAPAEPATPNAPPSTTRPVWALATYGGTVAVPALGRRYRDGLQAVAGSNPHSLRLINQLDVEEYLRGMGEVLDPSWPPAALRAQAIAARTYALRAMAVSGELCADQRCQVYLGQQREYPAMDRAVAETAGQVLTFEGNLVSAVYSANGGGFSASREEGFGPAIVRFEAGFPYLRPARYPTRDRFPWSVTISMADVAAELDYPGNLSAAAVTRAGPSGRALIVTVDGTSGLRTLSGVQFAAALGLRSTLFTVRPTTAAELPSMQARPSDPGSPGVGAALESTTAAASSSAAGRVSPSPAGDSGASAYDHQAKGGPRPPTADRWYEWWWFSAPLLISRRPKMAVTPAQRRGGRPRPARSTRPFPGGGRSRGGPDSTAPPGARRREG